MLCVFNLMNDELHATTTKQTIYLEKRLVNVYTEALKSKGENDDLFD